MRLRTEVTGTLDSARRMAVRLRGRDTEITQARRGGLGRGGAGRVRGRAGHIQVGIPMAKLPACYHPKLQLERGRCLPCALLALGPLPPEAPAATCALAGWEGAPTVAARLPC